MSWFAYVLECSDGSHYVGITTDLHSRVAAHNAGEGAAWTRMRRPATHRFAQPLPDKSSARRREIEIKGWRRQKKEALFRSSTNVVSPSA